MDDVREYPSLAAESRVQVTGKSRNERSDPELITVTAGIFQSADPVDVPRWVPEADRFVW